LVLVQILIHYFIFPLLSIVGHVHCMTSCGYACAIGAVCGKTWQVGALNIKEEVAGSMSYVQDVAVVNIAIKYKVIKFFDYSMEQWQSVCWVQEMYAA